MQTSKRTDIRKLSDRDLRRTVKSIVEQDTGERIILLARAFSGGETAD